jgi:tryptophanase
MTGHMQPYRIKSIEPLPRTTRPQRERALRRVHYNLFDLRAEEVTIDLLTDSGTGALSAGQLAAALSADESYAGSTSFHRFRDAAQQLTSYPHILPAHQGRAAERILFSTLLKPGTITLSNTHFDTTRANVELAGAQARDLPSPHARDLDSAEPFKGDIDLRALQTALTGPEAPRIALVLMTITNNGGGGQPVSMANLTGTAAMCRRHGVPLFLDAARFAENAWLVTRREAAYRDHTPRQVAQEAFGLADGCLMSAKKDGIVHTGGFLGLHDTGLARQCELLSIATEGFPTYGGLAGRDLDMMALGLAEALDPAYLESREAAAAHLAARIRSAGISLVEPPGMHALYLNAGRLLPHIPPHQFPGHALACQLYLEGGIRSAELGSLYLGRENDTHCHLDHVADVLERITGITAGIPGYRLTEQSPVLRHFRGKLEPIGVS